MNTSPTYLKDGQLFFKENTPFASLGDSLIIEPAKLSENIRYINRNNVRSVKINDNNGKLDNLEFLKDIMEVQGIAILQNGLDLTPLYQLKSLKRLHADSKNTVLDFGRFADVEILGTTYNKYIKNLSKATKLQWLWLSSFKETDLTTLLPLKELKTLNLNNTGVISLAGIGETDKLEYINIDAAKELVTLDGLTANNTSLEFLGVYNAKNLTRYDAIKHLPSLKRLFLGRVGNKDGLTFVKELGLEQVSIG